MKREIELINRKISYTLNSRKRTRRIWLRIKPDGSLTVSAPAHMSEDRINNFIKLKSKWIVAKLNYFEKYPSQVLLINKENLNEYRRGALNLAHSRLEYYNKIYKFKYSKVAIRNQKSRWGSCSRSGHLSFNFQIFLLPPKHADYIIVHELCHLGQMNHSKNFWNLVAESIPDHKKIRKDLRNIRLR